jgi:hypothetical protein
MSQLYTHICLAPDSNVLSLLVVFEYIHHESLKTKFSIKPAKPSRLMYYFHSTLH